MRFQFYLSLYGVYHILSTTLGEVFFNKIQSLPNEILTHPHQQRLVT